MTTELKMRFGLAALLTIWLTESVTGNVYSMQYNSLGGVAQLIAEPDKYYKQTNLDACIAACRAHATCTAFMFYDNHVFGSHCSLFENALGYGPLKGDDMISGQLDSSASTAALAWLGIGHFDYPFTLSKTATAAGCKTYCDETVTALDNDAECVQWNSQPGCCCFSSANAYIETTRTGARTTGTVAGLNVSKTVIYGDSLTTRYTPDQFPAAPVGPMSFTEMNYHHWQGLQLWMPFKLMDLSTWQDCAKKCHNESKCVSFLSTNSRDEPRKCALFDGAILGRVRPGYDKYGVINRVEYGAVSSVTPALAYYQYEGYYLSSWHQSEPREKAFSIKARILLKRHNVASFEDCAQHCYDFYRPVLCTGFFYFKGEERCELHDSVPCTKSEAHVNDRDYYGDNYYSWNDDDYWLDEARFGYINGRLSSDTLAKVNECEGT